MNANAAANRVDENKSQCQYSKIAFLGSVFKPDAMEPLELYQFLDNVKTGVYRTKVDSARRLFEVGNKKDYEKIKLSLPAVCLAGTFKTRAVNAEFIKSSGVLPLDIDNLGDDLVVTDSEMRELNYCLFSFVSPSGNGLKVGLRVNPDDIKNDADFKKVFSAVDLMFQSLGIEIDQSCKDVSRKCFVSDDSQIYINKDAEFFNWRAWTPEPTPPAQEPKAAKPKAKKSVMSGLLVQSTTDDCVGKLQNLLKKAKPHEIHSQRLKAGKLAGGYIAGGQITESEAMAALKSASDAIADGGATSDKEWASIISAIEIGKAEPIEALPTEAVNGELFVKGKTEAPNKPSKTKLKSGTGFSQFDVRDGTATTRALTELGNRDRLLDLHLGDIYYCPELKAWLRWDDQAWAWDVDGAKVRSLAAKLPNQIYTEGGQFLNADPTKIKMFHTWSRNSQTCRVISSAVSLLSDVEAVRLPVGLIDADLFLAGLDNAKQVIDLRTGKIRPAKQDDFITKSLAVSEVGDPTKAVRWLKFLDEVFNGDVELINWLQRFCGYLLTGSSEEHFLLFCYGFGRNGKGVFAETIKYIMSDYARVIKSETLAESRRKGAEASPDIAELPGARMVLSSETQENTALDENLIKGLVAADSTAARKLYSAQFEFIPQFKLIILGNHQPVIRGTDLGIWSRIRLVPFVRKFQGKDCDTKLANKLKVEAPHILAWMLAGCLGWQKSGMGDTPKSVELATNTYKRDQDIVGKWLDEYCELRPNHEETNTTLYTSYKNWTDVNGHRPVASAVLGRKLSERGFMSRRSNSTVYWDGVAVLLPSHLKR
ncbi:MAG: phage/plasmid primase, P4 family [Methylococcaceae bacterium]